MLLLDPVACLLSTMDSVGDITRLKEDGSIAQLSLNEVQIHVPTEEERATLRRVSDSIPWRFYAIAVVEMAERFSFYGTSVLLTNFIQQPLPQGSHTGAGFAHGQSGALGLGQRASTGLTTFYQFWCYIIPLFGAYIADTRWGRYKTICISVFIALLGHIVLIISSVPSIIETPRHSEACLIIGLIVTGLGTGGFKANIAPLVAEQYKPTTLSILTTPFGEQTIVDPALTISRIYMYYYLFINVGAFVGKVGMAYAEKYVGFWLAFTLPTIFFLLCPIILWIGKDRYERSSPSGSVLAHAMRILGYCMRGKWTMNPARLWKRINREGFWDAAKPSVVKMNDSELPTWMTYSDAWVDEVKRGFTACAVFMWFPIYCTFTPFDI